MITPDVARANYNNPTLTAELNKFNQAITAASPNALSVEVSVDPTVANMVAKSLRTAGYSIVCYFTGTDWSIDVDWS